MNALVPLTYFLLIFPDTLLNFPVLCIVLQPQGDYIELHQKHHGRRPDYEERKRKREAREVHKRSEQARKVGSGWLPIGETVPPLLPFFWCSVLY